MCTCKQSNATLTILKHFDWHASSNGKKYLSASTNPACFGVGSAEEDWSSLKLTEAKMFKFMDDIVYVNADLVENEYIILKKPKHILLQHKHCKCICLNVTKFQLTEIHCCSISFASSHIKTYMYLSHIPSIEYMFQ